MTATPSSAVPRRRHRFRAGVALVAGAAILGGAVGLAGAPAANAATGGTKEGWFLLPSTGSWPQAQLAGPPGRCESGRVQHDVFRYATADQQRTLDAILADRVLTKAESDLLQSKDYVLSGTVSTYFPASDCPAPKESWPKVSVGDFVWEDTNRNGVQDAGEPGIPGVTLTVTGPRQGELFDTNLKKVLPATTDANGKYSFRDLARLNPGEHYAVKVTAPAGFTPTTAGVGDRATDSSTGEAWSTGLTNDGDSDTTLDFGFVRDTPVTPPTPPTPPAPKKVSVGDFVWQDTNKNGIQDGGEPGIPGVNLSLSGPNGQTGTTTTDGNGKYAFRDLPALSDGQSYTVTIAAPGGYTPTTPGVGDRATDSSTGSATSTSLTTDGASDTTLDFGFVKNTPVTPPTPTPTGKVSVGDFVWQDTNKNGLQDAGEPGIPGVRLLLAGPDGSTNVTDVNGNRVGVATTDANGKYGFSNLPALSPGQVYKVLITNPAGYTPTLAGMGWDRATDSSTGYAASVPLTVNGASDLSLDFGFVKDGSTTPPPSSAKKVSVGDFVWLDANRNGVQDAGERGIAGVTLTLSGPNGDVTDVTGKKVGAVTTDANGKYSFGNLPVLPAGQSYRVRVTDPAGYVPTQPSVGADRAKDSSTSVAWSGDLTTDGASDLTLDFGFVAYNSSTSSI